MIDKFFKITERGSTLKTEILAGVTVFFSMSYILAVNPAMLSETGMDIGAVFTATAIAAAIGSLIMGLYANYPAILAPGMGMNAFFTYTICFTMGFAWQTALLAVFVSGVIFMALAFSGLREKIINAIPVSLKYAVSAGIGFFIAFIGLKGSGIIAANDATYVALGDIKDPSVILAIFGTFLVFVFLARNTKGAIFLALVITVICGIIFQIINLPTGIISPTPSISPVFGQLFSSPDGSPLELLMSLQFWVAVLSVLFIDFFDTAGTLIAIGTRAGFVNDEGKLIDAEKALISDATATTVGAIIGTSSVTTYSETMIGVEEGGRTGLVAVTVAVMMLLATFFSPLLSVVTSAVTAPALIGVGALMASSTRHIDFDEFADSAAAFITMLMMVLTYSIAEGLALGFITYTIIKVAAGQGKQVSLIMYGLTAIFIVRYLLMIFA